MNTRLLVMIASAVSLTSCALTPEQVAERIHNESSTELCYMIFIKNKYADLAAAEVRSRSHSCDWDLARAQQQESRARRENATAILGNYAASLNAQTDALNARSTYQAQQMQNNRINCITKPTYNGMYQTSCQ